MSRASRVVTKAVISPAILGRTEVPIAGDLMAFVIEPLLLEVLALENHSWLDHRAVSAYALDESAPGTPLG